MGLFGGKASGGAPKPAGDRPASAAVEPRIAELELKCARLFKLVDLLLAKQIEAGHPIPQSEIDAALAIGRKGGPS